MSDPSAHPADAIDSVRLAASWAPPGRLPRRSTSAAGALRHAMAWCREKWRAADPPQRVSREWLAEFARRSQQRQDTP